MTDQELPTQNMLNLDSPLTHYNETLENETEKKAIKSEEAELQVSVFIVKLLDIITVFSNAN
jgi:hypothetical protein